MYPDKTLNSKRYVHSNVHSSTIHSSQDMETIILCEVKQKQIPYDITFMRNLKCYTNELIYRAFQVAQWVKNLPAMQETWVGKIPWRRAWQPTPGFLPKDRGAWRATVHGVAELDMTATKHSTKSRKGGRGINK